MRCRRKPDEFEFVLWDGTDNSAVRELGGEIRMAAEGCREMRCYLFDKYGQQAINIGDYVVRDAGDGLGVLPHAYFEKMYEEVLG
jgi:hypothetical protein